MEVFASFSKWLTKSPLFPGRNRWILGRLDDPRTFTQKPEKIYGNYREQLWRMAIWERSMRLAIARLENPVNKHKQELYRYLAMRAEAEFIREYRLLPIRLQQGELSFTLFLLRHASTQIFRRVERDYNRVFVSYEEISELLYQLRDVMAVRGLVSSAPGVLRPSIAIHKAKLRHDLQRQEDRSSSRIKRLEFKQASRDSSSRQLTIGSRMNFLGHERLAESYHAMIEQTHNFLKILDEYPMLWPWHGLILCYRRIDGMLREIRKQTYNITKFSCPTGTHRSVVGFRNKWFKRFRPLLDDWTYGLSEVEGDYANLDCLMFELHHVLEYKARHFPHLTTDHMVQLGRNMWLKERQRMLLVTVFIARIPMDKHVKTMTTVFGRPNLLLLRQDRATRTNVPKVRSRSVFQGRSPQS